MGTFLGLVGAMIGCARAPLVEPPFVEATGSPIATMCIAPSAWNCYDPTSTRKAALDALEVADLARALQKPKNPAPLPPDATKKERRQSEAQELAPRAALAEEEEALTALRSYVACHPWDLDLTFELARRNFELNRFSDATYLFLRVAERSEDDRAAESFMRALESLNATAIRSNAFECWDEMEHRVPTRLARLCSLELAVKHPGRRESCTALGHVANDLQRMQRQRASLDADAYGR